MDWPASTWTSCTKPSDLDRDFGAFGAFDHADGSAMIGHGCCIPIPPTNNDDE